MRIRTKALTTALTMTSGRKKEDLADASADPPRV
jgi:hypothetical protein